MLQLQRQSHLSNGKPMSDPQISYRVNVSNNNDNETKFYYGPTDTSFKKRYDNHKMSFIHEQHKNDTELSKSIWYLTSSHKVPTIKWCIVRKIHGNAKSDFCKLCLTEKYFILNNLGDNKLLNKKSEFVNKCRHQKKLLLSSVLCEDSMDQIIFSFRYFSILYSITVLPLFFQVKQKCIPDECVEHETLSSILAECNFFILYRLYVSSTN